MNFVFISPDFPYHYWQFCDRLKKNGVNVLGIGDAAYDTLPEGLKNALTEYYKVGSMENYDEMVKAMGYFTFRYGKIDWVESNNEYWLEQDAKLRSDFNITTGLNADEIDRYKSKSGMKAYYERAGVPVARYHMADNYDSALAFVQEVGWPIVAKPDRGVGSCGNRKITNEAELAQFFQDWDGVPYIMEEYVDGEVATFDGISGRNAEVFYASSHVSLGSIMDSLNNGDPLCYYVDNEISPELWRAGEATIKSFDARNRYFHCEFFRLRTGKPGLGEPGDILGLEVNMRPAGGYTVDMLNYSGGLDTYQIWADMVAFGEVRHSLGNGRKSCMCCGRHDNHNYKYSHEEIMARYGDKMQLVRRLPAVLASMGDVLYMANFDSRDEMMEFSRLATERV